jgi:pimeloyl-ACP methyl ester carboxylesterase
MPALPRSHRVTLGTGLDYHVLEWGGEDAAREHSVLLVHGFLDLAWGWQAVAEAGLAERFHLVAPDLRGHGDSDRVGAGGYYHFFDYVADISEVVARFARRRLSLVGHSMGGNIASHYAGSAPDAVARLALLEGIGPPESSETMPERTARWLLEWPQARLRNNTAYADLEQAAARLRRNDPLLSPELATVLARHGTAPAPGGGVQFKHDPLHLSRGPFPFSVARAREFWQRIRCPVLFIDGDRSEWRLPAEEVARRRACFCAARVSSATIAGAGHMMQRHQPGELARLLIEFLEGSGY